MHLSRGRAVGRLGALLPEALFSLCLVTLAGTFTVHALASVAELGDRAESVARGAVLMEAAVEAVRSVGCGGVAPIPVAPPPRVRVRQQLVRDDRQVVVRVAIGWVPPRGRPPRPLLEQDAVVACP